MSLAPEHPESANADSAQEGTAGSPAASAPPSSRVGWQRRLLRVSLALFIFEIGAFLVIFPWTDSWNINYFQTLTPGLQDLWYQPSFRGALTGLGFVNIYIACLQVVYSFRRS
jgi:hypothetical protein